MSNPNFNLTVTVDKSPIEVFNAINNVRGWWSEEIEGGTRQLNDEFTYQYQDVHRCKIKLIEVVAGKKIVWLVLDNYFSFTKDKSEWIGTKIIFEITEQDNQTQIHFTHSGLVPDYECYNACVSGWTQYIQHSLPCLITTGKGQPNSKETAYTIHEVAALFSELAQQEKWFEIQDKLFADDVNSIEPANASHFKNASGKAAVRKKGEDFIAKVEEFHGASTTQPIIASNHFAVGRVVDITVKDFGRLKLEELMLYEVKDGKIISEQFFY